MKRKLLSLLREADLREEEIRLYFLLLKMQQAGIPDLIAKSQLPSMTVYRTMQRLIDRGLVETLPINNKQKLYRPLSLAALARTLAAQERRLRRLELSLKNLDPLLPFIDLESDDEIEDGIEVREGLDAFREEYLKFPDICKGEYVYLGNMLNYWDTAQMTYECAEERTFINKRLSRGIHCRIIDLYSDGMEKITKNDSREMRQSKLALDLPLKKNYLGISEKHASYFICEEENPRVLVIKQPELLDLYRSQFEHHWNHAA